MSKQTDRRVLCAISWAGALAIPVTLLALVGWPWLQRVNALQQEIESLDDQAARYHRLLKTLPALEAELEKARNRKDVEGYYFDAKTPALAGAELQRKVQQMVESSGGRVVSTQLLPSGQDESPPTVRVRTQIQGQTDALLDVLYQIEQARPFLFVEQLTVRAPRQRSTRSDRRRTRYARQRNQDRYRQLTIRLDVFGYALEATP